jgi:hypothetical protein
MFFDTSAVSASVPVLKPTASILIPLAYCGVNGIGVQCAHLA